MLKSSLVRSQLPKALKLYGEGMVTWERPPNVWVRDHPDGKSSSGACCGSDAYVAFLRHSSALQPYSPTLSPLFGTQCGSTEHLLRYSLSKYMVARDVKGL